MYLVIPGRHQLITQFQFEYLSSLIKGGLYHAKDVDGKELQIDEPIEAIIFPVTSANHSNTRRNPLPFYLRAISIEAMAAELNVPVYIYGIDDVGSLSNFANYTLKRIKNESDGKFDCTAQNSLIICSTPVLHLYQSLGFNILPAELADVTKWTYRSPMPWDIVEQIAASPNWTEDESIKAAMHHSSYNVWKKYGVGEKVKLLFTDHMIGSDGDLTETRDYNVYVRQMDDIAELKYHDTSSYVQPGRIGDIGCAVGSWMKLACKDERLRESDFYGIEVSRHLYQICQQRKENGEFQNPFVFFSQKNAVTGLVFDKGSMNTIYTSSLTHEIESYGSREDLLKFIKNRYDELAPGGVWINRDVVGPKNKEQEIYLWLNDKDGSNTDPFLQFNDRNELSHYLQSLSTYAMFLRFAKDFRKKEGHQVHFEEVKIENRTYIKTSLRNASEFLSRKDYTDNWESEMHETFCFWDFEEWKNHLTEAGFRIHPSSSSYTNDWIVKNRWEGKAELYVMGGEELQPVAYPETTMLLIGVK